MCQVQKKCSVTFANTDLILPFFFPNKQMKEVGLERQGRVVIEEIDLLCPSQELLISSLPKVLDLSRDFKI